MPRLRSSQLPEDSPVSTPTFPAGLMRKLTSRKEPKALAISSASIALSISSAFSNGHGTPSDTIGQGSGAGWQTAYAAAKIAVEIAKESSDMFPPLRAVLGAVSVLIANCDQTTDNREAVTDIERRVHLLSGVLTSPVNEDDYAEKSRRVELRRKLEVVIAKLEPLAEQHALLKFLRNADDAKTLPGFVQELADAITDYQVSIQQGIYERAGNIRDATKVVSDDTRNILSNTKNIQDDTKNILEVSELEFLEKLEPVRNAGYQGGHHDRCLTGTRESVLQDIMFWAKTPQDQNVFWLNGLAGTGKSTIAQSISETLAHDGSLGASFFCSRDFLDRRLLKHIFPTLAYQFACHYPHVRSHIIKIIKKDPTIAHTSLISQLENLIVGPLSEMNVSCVVVIDALDECIDDQPSSAILSVLGRFIKSLPLVKFFITGRPEPRIRTGFRLPLLEPLTQIFLLHEVKLAYVDKDIRLYITQRLTAIAKRRSDVDLPNPWPRENEIIALTKKSSGLFIFASTIVRFIESEHHEPDERLQLVLSKTSGTMHEGGAGVDSLYTQILLHAFSDVREPEVFVDIKRVLGAIVLAFNPLSRKELSTILSVPTSIISTTLRHLHSVMLVPADETEKIRVFHKSFPDFLQDRNRCTDLKFRVNPTTYHSTMALNCLELVKRLKVNPCGLPAFTMNRDVRDLPQLLENRLGGAVRYACCYWARHLKLSWLSDNRPTIHSITKMLKSATPWIEVMSLENRLGEVIHSMYSLLDWLDDMLDGDDSLHSLATDYLRLTMYFFHPIQQCAQQIYHTALPLSPVSSQLHPVYERKIAHGRICRVDSFLGAPDRWGLLLTTIDVRPKQLTCIATFAQKIVVACEDIVNIYDAVTFILEQSLRAPHSVIKLQESGNGSILYFAHSYSVTSWDSQTGGFVDTFTTQSEIIDMVVSPTGDHLACGLADGSVAFWNTRTMKEGSFWNSLPLVAIRWLSAAKLAVVTRGSIQVTDVATGETSDNFHPRDAVWGTVVLSDDAMLVGTSSKLSTGWGLDQLEEHCSLSTIEFRLGRLMQRRRTVKGKEEPEHSDDDEPQDQPIPQDPYGMPQQYAAKASYRAPKQWPESTHPGQLIRPTLAGNRIVCITPPSGVQALDRDHGWIKRPSLLDAAKSVAVSLNRNLAVQTEDSVQVFPIEVLTNDDTQDYFRSPHIYIYPLGEEHVVCVQENGSPTILELETLQAINPKGSPTWTNPPSPRRSFGSVEEFQIPMVTPPGQSWPIPTRRTEANEEFEFTTTGPPRSLWPPPPHQIEAVGKLEALAIIPHRYPRFPSSRRIGSVEGFGAPVIMPPRQSRSPSLRPTEATEEFETTPTTPPRRSWSPPPRGFESQTTMPPREPSPPSPRRTDPAEEFRAPVIMPSWPPSPRPGWSPRQPRFTPPSRVRAVGRLEVQTAMPPWDSPRASPRPIGSAGGPRAPVIMPTPGWIEGSEASVTPPPMQPYTPPLEWTEAAKEGTLLGGLSPNYARIATICDLPRRRLRVRDVVHGATLADLLLEDGDLGTGAVYHLAFHSETRFCLKVDGPGCHTQIPFDIISASPSGQYPCTIERGEPEPLSEPRKTLPYTLDTNCEWVLDAESRKICWISPENIRRGKGGHFWVGLSLVMLGSDGVVRKLTFKDPDF